VGLDVYLLKEIDNGDTVRMKDEPSENYPEHLCNKRYLRSSYNEAGFNFVARRLVGKDMYYIFQPGNTDDDGRIKYTHNELRIARQRAIEVIERFRTLYLKENLYGVTAVRHNIFKAQETTEDKVLEIVYNEEKSKEGIREKYNYSNIKGHFFFCYPLEVVAILPGKDAMGECIWIVYKMDEEVFQHYMQTAEIILEFIDNALTLPEPVQIVWSA